MKISGLLPLSLLLMAGCVHAGDPEPVAAPAFVVAITVDDLPVHAQLLPGVTRVDVADAHIAAFKAHGVPEAFGFVNAIGIEREPGSEIALDHWRAAGFPLGNHTYSHGNIRQMGLAAFEADLVKGEPAIADRMKGQDWKWLRFPFLSAGEGGDHDAVLAFARGRGYRFADVSISFSDWAYNDTYARCMTKGDTAAVAAMKTQYMEGVHAEIARAKAMSMKVYGRQIPHVLLTHIGGFSALMLPEVLTALDDAGAHYVTLAQAQSDPAYAETDAKAVDGSMMERTAGEQGIDLTGLPAGGSIAGMDQLCK